MGAPIIGLGLGYYTRRSMLVELAQAQKNKKNAQAITIRHRSHCWLYGWHPRQSRSRKHSKDKLAQMTVGQVAEELTKSKGEAAAAFVQVARSARGEA